MCPPGRHPPLITHIAVCGAGAFGRNHIRVYRELAAAGSPICLTAIVDPDPAAFATLAAAGIPIVRDTSQATPAANAVTLFADLSSMLAARARGALSVDAASVCVPTSAHHSVAAQLLASGIHVLVEKPITSTLAEADDLIHLARQRRRTLMVGHLERFNPAVEALRPLLRGPMFFEAHRLSVFSPRSLDVDVVLDLMIHDLDIVLTLADSPVTEVHAVGLPILSRKTDISNVRVEFASGCVANFTASRVSTERVRKLRFFQPHQYLSVDYARQDLLVIEVQPQFPPFSLSVSDSVTEQAAVQAGTKQKALSGTEAKGPATQNRETLAQSKESVSLSQAKDLSSSLSSDMQGAPHLARIWVPPSAGREPSSTLWTPPTLGMHKLPVTPGEPLRLELQAFLHAIHSGTEPPVSGAQARSALALALRIQEAIANHARHAGLQAFTAR